jgi:hypothetical protein
MKFLKYFLLLLIICDANAQESALWKQFLKQTDKASFMRLMQNLHSCKPTQPCSKEVTPTSGDVNSLIRLVDQGNEFGISISFMSLKFLDGGNLEDVIKALGVVSNKYPNEFLKDVKKYRLSNFELKSIVTSLPENSVDDLNLQKELLVKRISSLKSVRDTNLLEIRNNALKYIEKEIKTIEANIPSIK